MKLLANTRLIFSILLVLSVVMGVAALFKAQYFFSVLMAATTVASYLTLKDDKKSQQNKEQPLLSPIRSTLFKIEQANGYGLFMPRNELATILKTDADNPTIGRLANALNVTQTQLRLEMNEHLAAGGSIFACLGLIDMHLAD